MNILPHDIPKPKPEPVRVYNQKSGNVGRKPVYDWDMWGPKLKGCKLSEAARKVGCKRDTLVYAISRGKGGMKEKDGVIV